MFGLQNLRDACMYKILDRRQATLEHVELTFKGQYLGRHDMWQLWQQLLNTCVCVSSEVAVGSIRVHFLCVLRACVFVSERRCLPIVPVRFIRDLVCCASCALAHTSAQTFDRTHNWHMNELSNLASIFFPYLPLPSSPFVIHKIKIYDKRRV